MALADKLDKATGPPLGDPDPQLLWLFREGLRSNYDSRDTLYETLAAENLRSNWIAFMGLAAGLVLALAFGRGYLMLLGAAGALASRLAKVVTRRPLPNDYGTSWGPLILAPVAGALAAWAAVLLLAALHHAGINVLSTDKLHVDWREQPMAINDAVAFLFGFSERLFTRTVTSVSQNLLPPVDAPVNSEAPQSGRSS